MTSNRFLEASNLLQIQYCKISILEVNGAILGYNIFLIFLIWFYFDLMKGHVNTTSFSLTTTLYSSAYKRISKYIISVHFKPM